MLYNMDMAEETDISDILALEWHLDVGADEAIAEAPVNRMALQGGLPQKQQVHTVQPAGPAKSLSLSQKPVLDIPSAKKTDMEEPLLGTAEAVAEARKIAASCQTLAELEQAVRAFTGCPIKRTAKTTVFADGRAGAPIMVIGESPNADEDRQGVPFMGISGSFLDRMFAAIGYNRHNEDIKKALYLTNMIFWRPPGNRPPAVGEIQVCLPFVERHIELAKPEILVFSGAVAAKSLMKSALGITKLRGKWFDFQTGNMSRPVPAIAMYDPTFLLNSPGLKKYAWHDLLDIQARADSLN